MGKYYLYRHIFIQENTPFYIGIGTKCLSFKTIKTEYSRAFSKFNRSYLWKNKTKNKNYEVEILLESDDYEFIKQKELDISRVCISICIKNETHQNLKYMFFNEYKGLKTLPQIKFLRNYYCKKEVVALNLDKSVFKIFESVTECAKFFKTGRDTITDNCNKKIKRVYKKYYLCYLKDIDNITIRQPGLRVLKRLKIESGNKENEVEQKES